MSHTNISVVFINYRSAELINAGFARTLPLEARDYLVVDNSGEFEPSTHRCTVLKPGRNLGFGTAANLAAQALESDWMVLINPDLQITAEELAKFLAPSSQEGLALILPASNPDSPGTGFSQDLRHITKCIPATNPDFLFCQGFCLVAINLQAFRAIGGFDEKIFMYSEDLDLTIRLLKRFGANAVRSVPVEFTHEGGASYTGPFRKLRRLKDSFCSTCYVFAKHARHNSFVKRLFCSLLFSYPKLVRFSPPTSLRLDQE